MMTFSEILFRLTQHNNIVQCFKNKFVQSIKLHVNLSQGGKNKDS